MKVKGDANPYDPAWELFFEERLATQMASTLTGRGTARYLWLEQDGKCRVCHHPLTLDEGWHIHHLLWRSHGGEDRIDNWFCFIPTAIGKFTVRDGWWKSPRPFCEVAFVKA